MRPSKEVIDSWPKPNYVDPVTRGPALTIVSIVFIVLVFFVVGLRYYTRLRITKNFGTDDTVIGLSLIPTFALTVVVLTADNNFGWDRHSWDVRPEDGPAAYKLCLAAQILFFWAATLNKMSLLCFYKRLPGPFPPLWYKWSLLIGQVFLGAMLLAYFVSALCSCRPLSAFWTPLATYPYYCFNEGLYMLTFGVISIVLDFILLFLPVPIVLALQLPLKQRIAVCGIFFCGFIACIAGIVQVVYVVAALVSSYDETWDGWPLWFASALAVDVGILCVSVPAIRPLLAIYIPWLLESTRRPPVRSLAEVVYAEKMSGQSDQAGLASKSFRPGFSNSCYPVGSRQDSDSDLEGGQQRHNARDSEATFGI